VKQYAYGRIAKLAEQLEAAHVAPEIVTEIMEGGEAVNQGTSPEKKAAWLKEAMERMDRLLDRDCRYAVRQACACCLGGKRLEAVKGIARDNATLEDRIRAANEAKLVFGHSVTMQDDGAVLVRFGPEGQPAYRCPCLPKAQEPLSITYCYCCGGHVKHHLQIALGRELDLKVMSSVVSSGGRRPCSFRFTFDDGRRPLTPF
jgi:hypothetical protein